MFKEFGLIVIRIFSNPLYVFWILAISIFMGFLAKLILYLDSDVDF